MNQEFTPFSLAFAPTRFCPDIRKSLENEMPLVYASSSSWRNHSTKPSF
jgi:hypothetical protein